MGEIVAASPVYRTAPWGLENQAFFLNQVRQIETDLSPLELLHALQGIEHYMGRIRQTRWGSRLIDLDLIFFNDLVIDQPDLIVPHPRMHLRDIGLRFGIDGGRVSEMVQGLRTPEDPTMSRFANVGT